MIGLRSYLTPCIPQWWFKLLKFADKCVVHLQCCCYLPSCPKNTSFNMLGLPGLLLTLYALTRERVAPVSRLALRLQPMSTSWRAIISALQALHAAMTCAHLHKPMVNTLVWMVDVNAHNDTWWHLPYRVHSRVQYSTARDKHLFFFVLILYYKACNLPPWSTWRILSSPSIEQGACIPVGRKSSDTISPGFIFATKISIPIYAKLKVQTLFSSQGKRR